MLNQSVKPIQSCRKQQAPQLEKNIKVKGPVCQIYEYLQTVQKKDRQKVSMM